MVPLPASFFKSKGNATCERNALSKTGPTSVKEHRNDPAAQVQLLARQSHLAAQHPLCLCPPDRRSQPGDQRPPLHPGQRLDALDGRAANPEPVQDRTACPRHKCRETGRHQQHGDPDEEWAPPAATTTIR